MDDWQPTRVVTAAEFVGRFLTVRVAYTARGSSPAITVKVTPQARPDIAKLPYARWDSALRIPVPTGWKIGIDPWTACSYSGAPKGSAFSADGLGRIAGDASAETSRAQLAQLIDDHLDASAMNADARGKLRAFLAADFEELQASVLVRGDGAADTDELTLAAAQDLHDVVMAGQPLTERQLQHAEVLLKEAPCHFGYWGAFKALIKSVPVDHLSDAYAVAIARVSRVELTSSQSEPSDYENLDVLAHLFGLPSKKTRNYLARRVRRDLATLAQQSPDAYARVASRMLIAWDEPLSRCAYAPAFVMLGAASPLDERSDYVRTDVEMSSRRDPYPDIWDQRPDLARSVFTSVRSSVEALTWSFQVLESKDAGPLVADAIGLALQSTYPALQHEGSTSLAQHPEVFDVLSPSQWTAFFKGANDNDLAQVVDALTQLETLPEAVPKVVADSLLDSDEISDRRARVAVLYFMARKDRRSQRPDADVAALIVAIEKFQLEHQAHWTPITEQLRPQDLLAVYQALARGSGNDAALAAIGDAIIKKQWLAADLALDCISSDVAKVVELGWRLIDSQGGASFLFEDVLAESRRAGQLSDAATRRALLRVLPRAEDTQHVAQAAAWALHERFDSSELAALLAASGLGRGALWETVGSETDGGTTQLAYATAYVVRAVGDMLDAQQLPGATAPQLAFVLRYIANNPSRIAGDPSFGLAALGTADRDLQAEALDQLTTADLLSRVWLALAQSGHPMAVNAASDYIASLVDVSQVRDAVLDCVHCEVPAVQDMGLNLFEARESLIGDPTVWNALAELDSRRAQEWVAEAARAGVQIDARTLQAFDRRVLSGPRRSTRARTLVKQRLESTFGAIQAADDERIATLLELARSQVANDREWALMRLASLALEGVHVDGLEVSLTTEGTVTAGDIS